MSKLITGAHRDELEAVISVVRDAIIKTKDDSLYDAAQGALAIAGGLGLFCHCTTEHKYLQPIFDMAVLKLDVTSKKRFLSHPPPCKHQ